MEGILQTPESRFSDLKDCRFKSNYITINNLQMHYLDEGPDTAKPFLFLHGVQAWSYLYRHMISKISETGIRAAAPDPIGFGRSDKPAKINFHTYQSHIDWMTEFIIKPGLREIILFCHNWGSFIGLRLAANTPDLFSGIIVSNGMLPAGEQKLHIYFKIWRFITRYIRFIPVDKVIESGTLCKLDKEERRAYRAPFPSKKYYAGIRALPGLIATTPDEPESAANKTAWESLFVWKNSFLTLFSTEDPITLGGDEYLLKRIPGATGQDHLRIDTGHFIQEDRSSGLADIMIRFRKKPGTELSSYYIHDEELEMSD
jgi:haloalkane dehalogenase